MALEPHKKKGSSGPCVLCPKNFWGGFCKPRYPGVHIILLIVLLNLFYTCTYLVMTTYFDAFSTIQHMGYVMILIANVVIFMVGLLTIHFLVQKPQECRISYCIFLHIAMILASGLGVIAVLLMLYKPTPEQMRNFAKNYIRSYARAPYFIKSLFIEKKCCGITKYKDVLSTFTNKTVMYYRVPPACCRREPPEILSTCKDWLHVILNQTVFYAHDKEYLYQEPCLKDGEDFSTIQGTETYAIYFRNLLGISGLFIQIFVIFVVLNYYIWYRFPKVEPESLRPSQFNRDIRNLVKCRWHALRRDLKARRKTNDELHAKAVSGKSDFTLRHELIKQSMASIGLIQRDLLEAKEKEKELQAVSSSSPELVSPVDSSPEQI